MSEGKVTGTVRDGILRLTIDDPGRRNALGEPMAEQAIHALDSLLPDARVLVIAGAGEHFCSGANLSFDPKIDIGQVDGGAALLAVYGPLMRRIAE
jgi:enoyl-CoA hydratase/carnithine racemase